MGDGAMCHECRRYHCVCGDESAFYVAEPIATAAEQWNAIASNPQTLLDERNALRDALLDIRKRISGRRLPFCDDIREVIKLVIPLLLCMALSGCVQPIDPAQPVNPDDRKPVAGSLEQIAYQSFQDRDVVRAKKLRAIKGTRYDANRIKSIEIAGAEASRETWAPVAAALADRLDSIPQSDQAAFDAVLEEIAVGSERASK